jgi:hypothetical protein
MRTNGNAFHILTILIFFFSINCVNHSFSTSEPPANLICPFLRSPTVCTTRTNARIHISVTARQFLPVNVAGCSSSWPVIPSRIVPYSPCNCPIRRFDSNPSHPRSSSVEWSRPKRTLGLCSLWTMDEQNTFTRWSSSRETF